MEPHHPVTYVWLGRTLFGMQRFEEALTELHKGIQIAGRMPLLLQLVGSIYGKLGMRAEASEILEELRRLSQSQYISPIFAASVLGAMGELDQAFELYDRAVEERSGLLVFLNIHGALETFSPAVRADSRFAALRKSLHLDS
jgi:tetratricopeptide (TPR) repeat protein